MKMKLYLPILFVFLLLTGCELEQSDGLKSDGVATVVQYEKVSAEAGSVNNDTTSETDNFAAFEKAKVVRVVDGDTLVASLYDDSNKNSSNKSGTELKVRIILVNTPESVGDYKDNPQPFGVEASNFSKQLLENRDIWLEYDVEDTDRYGRTLAYVWLKDVDYEYEGVTYHEDEVMLNELLLKHGLAHVAVYKPNVKYKERFYQIENEAKSERLGMWE